jgi:hypothetical protein
MERLVDDWGVEEEASVMVSRMKRTERTTFNWTTALHDARSLRNAYYQVLQSILEFLSCIRTFGEFMS